MALEVFLADCDPIKRWSTLFLWNNVVVVEGNELIIGRKG
jgi:hypothetical protein